MKGLFFTVLLTFSLLLAPVSPTLAQGAPSVDNTPGGSASGGPDMGPLGLEGGD